MSNEKVHNITKVIPWSKIVENRRLRWFGQLGDCLMVRLPNKHWRRRNVNAPCPEDEEEPSGLISWRSNYRHTAWTLSKRSLTHRTESTGGLFATKPDLYGKQFPFFRRSTQRNPKKEANRWWWYTLYTDVLWLPWQGGPGRWKCWREKGESLEILCRKRGCLRTFLKTTLLLNRIRGVIYTMNAFFVQYRGSRNAIFCIGGL